MMAYLKDFRARIAQNDYPGFLKIWEEYCYGDQPDAEEIVTTLEEIRTSELAKPFGLHVERIIPLWRELKDFKEAYDVLRLVLDLQTTQSETIAQLAIEYLEQRFPQDPLFQEKLRLVGLRNREMFQGAIRNFELLTHFDQGNFVFHTAGWGTGEILDVSLIREEISVEFEYVLGPQSFSFEKAFKTLMPLESSHFLARRFGVPDELEAQGREDPAGLIHLLLKDLGPKTTAEIKEELCDLVIPAADWNRWWQNARAKLKKDTKIESPQNLKQPFKLRKEEVSHETLFYKALEANPETNATIHMTYAFLRDFPESLKSQEFQDSLKMRLEELLHRKPLAEFQRLSLLLLMEEIKHSKVSSEISQSLKELVDPVKELAAIEILPLQKKALQKFKKLHSGWEEIFLELIFKTDQNLLRDFLFQELDHPKTHPELKKRMCSLLVHPLVFPEVLVWYFQKIVDKKARSILFEPKDRHRFFEALLVLLDDLEEKTSHRDLVKKILTMITEERYLLVRELLSTTSLAEAKELVLLATKCHSFSDHDIRIFYSLAEVVHPSISQMRKSDEPEEETVLWTTEQGFLATKERLEKIATVETVQNAKEIEEARSHGDLRENAEFKAALEKRGRLQSEMKFLSEQIAQARIITPNDINTSSVGIGVVVHCQSSQGEHSCFTLLGPWDADPENRILSFQSKFAESMKGKKIGETFSFQGETFQITEIQNYFDQKTKNL